MRKFFGNFFEIFGVVTCISSLGMIGKPYFILNTLINIGIGATLWFIGKLIMPKDENKDADSTDAEKNSIQKSDNEK